MTTAKHIFIGLLTIGLVFVGHMIAGTTHEILLELGVQVSLLRLLSLLFAAWAVGKFVVPLMDGWDSWYRDHPKHFEEGQQ